MSKDEIGITTDKLDRSCITARMTCPCCHEKLILQMIYDFQTLYLNSLEKDKDVT